MVVVGGGTLRRRSEDSWRKPASGVRIPAKLSLRKTGCDHRRYLMPAISGLTDSLSFMAFAAQHLHLVVVGGVILGLGGIAFLVRASL